MKNTNRSYFGTALTDDSIEFFSFYEPVSLETIALAVIDALPDEKLGEFETVLKRANEEEIRAYIEANVPNAHDVIAEISKELSEDIRILARS